LVYFRPMNAYETIQAELKTALKESKPEKVMLLRGLVSAIKNEIIAKRAKDPQITELTEEEQIQVLSKEAKKRKEAVQAYNDGGRADLAEKEQRELDTIAQYLPAQMSEDDLKAVIKSVVESDGLTEFGPAMQAVMAKVKGQADGKQVSQFLKQKLENSDAF